MRIRISEHGFCNLSKVRLSRAIFALSKTLHPINAYHHPRLLGLPRRATEAVSSPFGAASYTPLSINGRDMDNLISLEFLSQQSDTVLKAWAIVIPLLVLLLWVAWKMRGIFRA